MKPTFETSEDVHKLIEYLSSRESASYGELNRHVGRRLNGNERYVLQSALRQLERSRGIVFVVERGVGIARATNGQVAKLSTDHALTKMRRTNHRAKKRQHLVNVQGLTTEERAAFYIGRAALQAVEIAAGKKMRRQIEEAIAEHDGEPLDMRETVALFKKRAH